MLLLDYRQARVIAAVAAVICFTRTTAKVQRKRRPLLKSLYARRYICFEFHTHSHSLLLTKKIEGLFDYSTLACNLVQTLISESTNCNSSGFKLALSHHMDMPIMDQVGISISPGSMVQISECQSYPNKYNPKCI